MKELPDMLIEGAAEKDGVFFYTKPPTNNDQRIRSSQFKDWTRWRKENFFFFDRVLQPLGRESVLVDIGAGSIHFKDLLFKFKYVGVDFFPFPGVTVVADLSKGLPFKDRSADIVFLSNVLEHMPHPGILIKECVRILRPGGVIVGTIPFLMRIHQAPYDFNRFTHFQLERMLADFIDVSVEPLGAPSNAFRTLTRHFFETAQKGSSGFKRLLIWVSGLMVRAIVKFVPLDTPVDSSFTEGYGFYGKKPAA